MRTAVVVGNPKPQSRTLAAGVLVAEMATGSPPDHVIDLVDLGPSMLGWDDPVVAATAETVTSCEVVIVASPTFKATYTGLLKLFLDQVPAGGLSGVVAVPLMLGAGPGHQLAPELLLKPVLVELGATCPTPGLYLQDSSFATDPKLAPWVERAAPILAALTAPKT